MGMAILKKQDVIHVAKLAKLNLKDKEVDKFQKQLSKVIEYISELQKLDLSATDPTSQTTGLEDVFREDKVVIKGCLTQDEALSGTEEIYNGYFKIPAVFKSK